MSLMKNKLKAVEKSTRLPITTDANIEVHCLQCKVNASHSHEPVKPQGLGTIIHFGDKPVFWKLERLSDRTPIGALYTWGLHPRGGYEALGWTDEEAVRYMGYPNVALYQRDAARVAQLAKEGVRAFDFWPSTFFPLQELMRDMESVSDFFSRAASQAREAEQRGGVGRYRPPRRWRVAATSLADGIRTRCRFRHSHNVTRPRLVQLLQSPALQGNTLYLPHR